jgi:AraC-like DNA-binding protein
VTLTHVRTDVSHAIRRFFGCPINFGAVVDEVSFSKTVLQMPLTSADPFLNVLLRRYADEARSARAIRPGALRLSVENAMVPLLPHRKIRASEIGRSLGLSQRTLARRLMSEGLCFAGILCDLRYDLATKYVKETNLPISTIAWLLGYEQVSSFTHAFKRWEGQTPKQARRAVRS